MGVCQRCLLRRSFRDGNKRAAHGQEVHALTGSLDGGQQGPAALDRFDSGDGEHLNSMDLITIESSQMPFEALDGIFPKASEMRGCRGVESPLHSPGPLEGDVELTEVLSPRCRCRISTWSKYPIELRTCRTRP